MKENSFEDYLVDLQSKMGNGGIGSSNQPRGDGV